MSKRAIPAIVAGSLGLSGAAYAAEEQPSQQELMEQINALKAQVERLRVTQEAQQNKLTAQEVDATVESVLTDAERRSQLLQSGGFTAGYSKGKFLIQSEDGNFVMNPNLQLQVRYVANHREEDAEDEVDGRTNTESGFELRRTKFSFDGNAFTSKLKYQFQWATSRTGGGVSLEAANINYKFADAFGIKLGQYKDPTFHEEITSSKRQLAVDRSLANEYLAGGVTDYIQGIALTWDDGPDGLPLRGELGYSDGPNSDNTGFVDAGGSSRYGVANPDFGGYARLEYLAFGDFKQYDDFTALKNTDNLLVIGGGAFYTQAGDAMAVFHTADAQLELDRLALYAAYYGVYSDAGAADEDDEDGDADSVYDMGGVAQAGLMVTDKLEVFGRYSLVSLDAADAGEEDEYNEITVGLNYYFQGHAAKFTADVVYLPDGAPQNDTGIGHLDPDADDEQFALRAQFQLLL